MKIQPTQPEEYSKSKIEGAWEQAKTNHQRKQEERLTDEQIELIHDKTGILYTPEGERQCIYGCGKIIDECDGDHETSCARCE